VQPKRPNAQSATKIAFGKGRLEGLSKHASDQRGKNLMVNIVDTFTQLYGRPPRSAELMVMMKMKADQEQGKLRFPKLPVKKKTATVSSFIFTINKLMLFGLSEKQIAEAILMPENVITNARTKYKLPKKELKVSLVGTR
tara:strand:+ start:25 stop:444 length:420 start_codon:yes stop_codon:yes gene_type:complete